MASLLTATPTPTLSRKGIKAGVMMDYEVVFSLQAEALRTFEARAAALRTYLEAIQDPDAECRLETIERILRRLYLQDSRRSFHRVSIPRQSRGL